MENLAGKQGQTSATSIDHGTINNKTTDCGGSTSITSNILQ